MPARDIIVVGGSAGGVEALRELAAALPANLPAAVFIVLHVPPQAPSVLPAILSRAGPLSAITASDGVEIRPGRIYTAPPDHHMVIEPLPRGTGAGANHNEAALGRVRITRGPRENGHRPAVDPLFRSAAVAFGPRVAGVVLSGNLDDGTAGLWAICAAGGVGIVQDPTTALYADMPSSALRHARPEHVLPIAGIARLLNTLACDTSSGPPATGTSTGTPPAATTIPGQIIENAMSKLDPTAVHDPDRPGQPSGYGCPSCGGALFEIVNGELVRYRCRVGHAFSPESLVNAQADGIEEALWTALRALEESAAFYDRLAERFGSRNDPGGSDRFHVRGEVVRARAEIVRRLLLGERQGATREPSPTETR